MHDDHHKVIERSFSLKEKLEFLREKHNYINNPKKVEIKETHMSIVFLTDHIVYKLKKPVKFNSVDFRSLESRERNCREEIRLNRRLSEGIYLDVVPLITDDRGNLRLGVEGEVVDWLVKMKRLPENRMLDHILKQNRVSKYPVRQAAIMLSEFYKNSVPALSDAQQYRYRLKKEILDTQEILLSAEYALPIPLIKSIIETQLGFLDRQSELFNQRIKSGKIIEAHGDLRPDHICMTLPPVIIDCLEFNRALRILDIAEELSFFSVGCEMLGSPETGNLFFKVYEETTGDMIPQGLIIFFKSKQACLKAKFKIWHLNEKKYRSDPKWTMKSKEYLYLAEKYARLLRADPMKL